MGTIQTLLGSEIPYTGCLSRGVDDVEALSSAFGYLWERFGPTACNLNTVNAFFNPDNQPGSMLSNLPIYPWDKRQKYWVEPRLTTAFLRREAPSHPLLGDISANSTSESWQWINIFKPKEISWLDGHQLQGQTILPAAAYAVMAMEAAKHVVGERQISLIEILDLVVGKAVSFDSESDAVEVVLNLNVEPESDDPDHLELRFSIDSSLAKETSLSWSAGGRVVLSFGSPNSMALPPPSPEVPLMSEVNTDAFYDELNRVGYGYHQDFRGIETLRRTTNCSAGTLRVPQESSDSRPLVIHPAPLDVAFQAFIAAFCAPGDGRLWSLHVPTSIKRIAVNPWLSALAQSSGADLSFCSNIASEMSDTVRGDIDVFFPETGATVVQVEQISFKPFAAPTAADDRLLFSEWVWAPLTPDAVLSSPSQRATDEEKRAAVVMERMTYYYTRQLLTELLPEDRTLTAPHFQHMLKWGEHVVDLAKTGKHPYWQESWERDSHDSISELAQGFPDRADVEMIDRIGKNLLAVVNDEAQVLEIMTEGGLLGRFYQEALGFRPCYHHIAKLVEQIAHRHPNLEVLEIGKFPHRTDTTASKPSNLVSRIFDFILTFYRRWHWKLYQSSATCLGRCLQWILFHRYLVWILRGVSTAICRL